MFNFSKASSKFIFIVLSIIVSIPGVIAQKSCEQLIGSVYGSISINERAYCLAPAVENTAFYIGGNIDGNILITKMGLDGISIWSREINAILGIDEYINSMFIDSEGMLVLSGNTTDLSLSLSIFVIRYDPINNLILWAKEFKNETRIINHSVIELGEGGNYVLSNSVFRQGELLNIEILSLDRISGIILNNSLHRSITGEWENITNLFFENNTLFGSGKITINNSNNNSRNIIAKFDTTNVSPLWIKGGHVGIEEIAKMESADVIVAHDALYSLYHGTLNAIDVSKLYLQKSNLNGDLIWIKQFEFPGAEDVGLEMIESKDGIVVLGSKRTPGDIALFKIDTSGTVLWAHQFEIPLAHALTKVLIYKTSQLIEVGDHLIFATQITDSTGKDNMVVVKTDLNGKSQSPCIVSKPIKVHPRAVDSPVFYEVNLSPGKNTREVILLNPEIINYELSPVKLCTLIDTIITTIDTTLCAGTLYDGYGVTGLYTDTFQLKNDCDSIRVLNLLVNECQSECGIQIGAVYGGSNDDIRGHSLAATLDNNGFYVAGYKNDSVLISKMDLSGHIEWSRTFSIVPSREHNVSAIIVDSEGMVAITGVAGNPGAGGSGTIFAFRYDPASNQVLWAREYINGNRNYSFSIIQKGDGGNYIISNNPHFDSQSNDLGELLEINKNNGDINPAFAKNYDLGPAEQLVDIIYYDKAIYGVGRYTITPSPFGMRHALVKINPNDGTHIWAKLGHVPLEQAARLYGFDLTIHQGEIYSGYFGDPAGSSTTNSKLYLQKTSLDGELLWLRQYQLPGSNDEAFEIISSADGVIILAGDQNVNETVLFKIDPDGDVLWSREYGFPLTGSSIYGRAASQLIQIGDQLIFTGYGSDNINESDLFVVRTNLSGEANIPCVEIQPISIPIIKVSNPIFFSVEPEDLNVDPDINKRGSTGIVSNIDPLEACVVVDSIHVFIEATICSGESFEGYSSSGIFTDTFFLSNECDSIRTLTLTVIPLAQTEVYEEICAGQVFLGYTQTGIYSDTFSVISGCDSIRTLTLVVISCQPIVEYDLDACRSYMSDGSHMDYSEFTPAYPTTLRCADVSATFLRRDPLGQTKHSCTPGVNGTPAMCVTTLNSCTYTPGHSASIIIEVTINPDVDSTARFTGFEFYEKSPTTYSWIDGPSGLNDYPRFYGIRILKDGVEIFQDPDISTTTNWTLQSFDFIDNDLFRVEESATFRIELLPYCPVGNGAEVSAWDVDEFRIFGGCVSPPVITGSILTKNGKSVPNVQLLLADNNSFTGSHINLTDEYGNYIFNQLPSHNNLFLRGYKNDDILKGVSTLDLLHIQKHLLGIKPFTSLHQYVAADINYSNGVNAIDIVELRKVILGLSDEFPRNTSWRFGVLPQDFSGVELSAFLEIKNMKSIPEDTLRIDFVGIKIGDVNGDIQLSGSPSEIESRYTNTLSWFIQDAEIKKGAPVTMEVRAGEDFTIEGFQLALQTFDLIITGIKAGIIQAGDDNISIDKNGIIRMSWSQHGPIRISEGDVLFALEGVAGKNTTLAQALIPVEKILSPEVYLLNDSKPQNLKLVIENSFAIPQINSFDIEPNPFQSELQISFNMSTGGNVEIKFYDASGKIVLTIDKVYSVGEHVEQVVLNDQAAWNGLIYCQLVSSGYTGVKRLVRLKR